MNRLLPFALLFLFPSFVVGDCGTAPLVVVPGSAPLVYTKQVDVEGTPSVDSVRAAAGRLQEILQTADSSLDQLVKLNVVVCNDFPVRHEPISSTQATPVSQRKATIQTPRGQRRNRSR